MVEFGYNRDHEDLPQINLGLVVDSGSKLPLYYHVHDGDIRDVSTLEHVMKEGFAFNMKNMLFVMDKGFYAKHNINSMYSFSYQFIDQASVQHNRHRQRRGRLCKDIILAVLEQ